MKKTVATSLGAAFAVAGFQIVFYFTLLSVLAGSDYAREQFGLRKFYILGLAIGFGIQIGLFRYLRATRGKLCPKKVVLVSGAASTASMVSCCTMHLASLLPVIGASGIISTLGQYQVSLYWLGLLVNLAGIALILSRVLKTHRAMRKSVVLSLIAIAALSLVALSCGDSNQSSLDTNGAGPLQSQTNQDGSVSVTVTPEGIPDAASWDFKLALDTHTGDLSEDFTQLSVLEVDGKEYKPVTWDEEDQGMMGHHLRGVLKFNPVVAKPTMISLKIRQIGGVDERSFVWNLSA